jgi:acetyl esterase/lipase
MTRKSGTQSGDTTMSIRLPRLAVGIGVLLVLHVVLPTTSDASSEISSAVDGTVDAPSFKLPLSRYISPAGRQRLIDAARTPPADAAKIDWSTAPIEKIRAAHDEILRETLEDSRAAYPVDIVERTIAGVRTRVLTPKAGVPAGNRHRVLMNLHGGGFFMGANAEALVESIAMASLGGFRVVTVDYRQGPEHRHPAASEDVAAVYAQLIKEVPARNIGVYGCSAGGSLSAMAAAWFNTHNLPRPGAIGIFSAGAFGTSFGDPMAAGSWGGDSRFVGPVVNGQAAPLIDANWQRTPRNFAQSYLSAVDLTDPLVSPAESLPTLAAFPPTLLMTGTRAYDMSAAVQTHRQLIRSGATAELHLWDGLGHCFLFDVKMPESREAVTLAAKFFDRHLGADSLPVAGKMK